MKVKAKNVAKIVFFTLIIAWGVWMFASLVDTNIHNGDMNYHYSNWNFFQVMLRMRGM